MGWAAVLAGCDQGSQNQAVGAGGPIQVVGQYPAASQALPSDGRIEFAFNRYLLPFSVSRQSFVLHASGSGAAMNPTVDYDPVARTVTITPLSDAPLQVGQSYEVDINAGLLRAIDGAELDPNQTTAFTFLVEAGDGGTPAVPSVDYCHDIAPIFVGCSGCHSATGQYAGLSLSSPAAIAATAVGKTAHGANTGLQSTPEPPGPVFGVDTPIIDPGSGTGGGDPANSWLLYKVLLGYPPATSAVIYSGCDGGTYLPADVTKAHLDVQPALTNEANDGERANLANEVPGREMPFPLSTAALANPALNTGTLTVDELERVNLWIGAGAPLPAAPGPCQ